MVSKPGPSQHTLRVGCVWVCRCEGGRSAATPTPLHSEFDPTHLSPHYQSTLRSVNPMFDDEVLYRTAQALGLGLDIRDPDTDSGILCAAPGCISLGLEHVVGLLGTPWGRVGPRGPQHPALAGCSGLWQEASILPEANILP